MRLRFYAALLLSVLAGGLGLFDIFVSTDANVLRASLGIVMGLSVILIALAFANKKMTRDDDKT